MKFNAASIATLKMPEGKTEHYVWDDDTPGFGIRLRGKKATWIVTYHFGGRPRRLSAGDIRQLTLEAARKKAKNWFAEVRDGIDPAVKKEQAQEKLTFGVVAEQYIAVKKGTVREGTFKRVARELRKHCAPLAKKPIADIKRADIAMLLHHVIAQSAKNPISRRAGEMAGRAGAANVRNTLSAFFKWCMGEGIIESNPVNATNDPGKGIKPRNRVLPDEELAAVWHASESQKGDYGQIIKLFILTGCRLNEIAKLQPSEIEIGIVCTTGKSMNGGQIRSRDDQQDSMTLRIPGDRIKNEHELVLSLPPMAMDILRKASREEGRKFVFGTGNIPMGNWDRRLKRLHKQMAEMQGKQFAYWSAHDLRRSVRTGMGRLGIAPHIAERVLNHVKGGIEAIYDHYSYDREIKQALALWADHVASIIEGKESNVTTFRRV